MIAQERERQENKAAGEGKMIAQERERQENRAEGEGRKKRFAGTGMVRGRLICERNSRQVLTNLLTNSGRSGIKEIQIISMLNF